MIPDFKTFIKESIWSDIQDRSSGDTVRKEDDVNLLDRDEFYDYLKNKYNKISHLIYEDQSEIHITLGWSYFPRRDYKIDIHWVEKNKIKNLYLNFGPCELDTLCNKKFKTGTANDDISNEEILNIIDFCLDYISSHKECESPMNESIWSDIQDRSLGDTVRKEDEKQHLFDTLTKLYPPINSANKVELYNDSIVVNLFKCIHTYSNLIIYDHRKFVEFSTINPSKYKDSRHKKLYPIFSNLWKELADNFTFVDFSDYDGIEHWGIEHWHTIKYKPKDGGLVDEKFCISIINCIVDFIDDTEDIIKIINNSNDTRF